MGQVTLTQQCLKITFPEAWEVNPYFLALLLLQANFRHDSGKKKNPFFTLRSICPPSRTAHSSMGISYVKSFPGSES